MQIRLTIPLVIATFLTLVSYSLLANEYLDELASEAEATANISSDKPLDAAEQEQFKKMEALIKEKKPSTYRFYAKLSTKNKERAFKYFSNDSSKMKKRMSHLKKKIMDLYFTQ